MTVSIKSATRPSITAQIKTQLDSLENDMHRRFDQVYLLLLDIQDDLRKLKEAK